MAEDVTVVASLPLPYSDNIYLDVSKQRTSAVLEDSAWLVQEVREQGVAFSKTLIYALGTITKLMEVLADIKLALADPVPKK